MKRTRSLLEPGMTMTGGQRDDWNGKALLSSFIPRPRRMIIIPIAGEMLPQSTAGGRTQMGQGAFAGARVRRSKEFPGSSTLSR
jgi:hypothetical protein